MHAHPASAKSVQKVPPNPVSATWSDRLIKHPAVALDFARELKQARLCAQEDAEGWMPLVLAFERLGKYMTNEPRATLGRSRTLFEQLVNARITKLGFNQTALPPSIMVELVMKGRNEEFHGGSAARRFASHCLELGLLIEDSLLSLLEPMKIGYVMSSNPTCAEPDLPLYHVRRLMLEHSFSWLPIRLDTSWAIISDHAIVRYKLKDTTGLAASVREAIAGPPETRLEVVPAELVDENCPIDEAIVTRLQAHPILVKASNTKHLIGIATAFDLL